MSRRKQNEYGKLAQLRIDRNMTQTELADALGAPRNTVQRLETGVNDLRAKLVKAYAKALKVKPEVVLDAIEEIESAV